LVGGVVHPLPYPTQFLVNTTIASGERAISFLDEKSSYKILLNFLQQQQQQQQQQHTG
jgi:hypothetical protein